MTESSYGRCYWHMSKECNKRFYHKVHDAQGLSENQQVAKRGGKVAGDARKAIEADTGKPVITSQNAVDFSRLIADVIEDSESKNDKPE